MASSSGCIVLEMMSDGSGEVMAEGHDLQACVTPQNSMTALIVAVRGGYTAVVKELLKRKPNVNMTDKDGNTALMIAAKEGHTQIVQDLLDAGTYVNIPDRVRAPRTPQHATAAIVATADTGTNKTDGVCVCVCCRVETQC